ncbi:MAG: glycosyltransferase [Rivularia sp. (in: cyanobacteria)]
MNIAFIVGDFPILSETFILNQITGLLDRGHQVDIYADRPGNLEKLHDDVLTYNLLERTYYLPEIPENLFWRAIKGCGVLVSKLIQAPKETLQALNFFKHGQQAISLWLLYTLIPNLQRNYDIIHCQFGTVGFKGMAFRSVNSPSAKLITIFRGHDISNFVQEHGENIYKPLFASGDYFLANCEFFKRRVIELGCNTKLIRVHGSGLDYSRFPFQTRQYPKNGLVRIATTGRLVEKKGIEYSIRAVAQVLKQHSNLNLEYIIIGDGPLQSEFEQLVVSLKAEQSIKLVGQKSQSEIIDLLKTSHLFIAPSVTASDGNQDAPINVLKEAMAMGLPVISTLHGGIPELVEEGVSGFLVPERDAAAIADKLVYLIEHPEGWAAMGEAGRSFVEQHYDLNRLNDRLVALYESLLDSEEVPHSEIALPLSQ